MNHDTLTKRGAIILATLTLVGAMFLVRFFPKMPIVSDSEDYNTIATSILTTHFYPSIPNETLLIYPPLYPFFVAGVYTLTSIESYTSVYFVQYLLVGALALLLFFILRRYKKTPFLLALGAGITVLVWPYLILYSQLISSEVLYSLLLLIFFTLIFSLEKKSSWWHIGGTGIILGLTLLTRPVALLLFPWLLIGLGLLSFLPGLIGRHALPWKNYFFVLIIAFVTLVPWELYVHKHYGEIIPVASNLGNVFKKANKTFAYLPETEKPSVIEAKVKNLYLFWDPGASGYHLDIVKDRYPVARIAVSVYKLFFFALLAIALYGAVRYRKDKLVLFASLIILYTWALHTVLFPFPRYTLPIIPFVIIVATATLTHEYQRRKNTGSHPSS